ncbi:MAG: hypothetical protein ACRC2R_26735 [Xenococcaceae cyanobacterium]
MYQYRVTKYNPVFRDEKGRYTHQEWTSFGEVGEIVPVKEYIRVEAAYIEAALDFLREAAVVELQIRGLENSKKLPTLLVEGKQLSLKELASTFRKVLRNEIWCRFEGESTFVHFGWDYYMYVGVSKDCPKARACAEKLGLFVEEFQSPYMNAV